MGRPEEADSPAPQRIRMRFEVARWDWKVLRSVGEMVGIVVRGLWVGAAQGMVMRVLVGWVGCCWC